MTEKSSPAIPDVAEIRRRLGPLPSAAEVEGLRESVRLLGLVLREIPESPAGDLDPGHIFPVDTGRAS